MHNKFHILGTFYVIILLLSGDVFAAKGNYGLPDFTALVEENSAAVINIGTTQAIKHPRLRRPPFNVPDMPEGPLNDLFKHFFDEGKEGQEPEEDNEIYTKSLGSGFIISSDGYVLTNHHVVKNADEIIVRLSDRREYEAEIVGSDEKSDLALLKIDAADLPVVKMNRADELKVGEWVLAIGSPFGFDHTVTAGIVSAKGRSLPRETYVPFIQTDVAINPGNSGGPLFDLEGNVIGINSQIFSRTGGFMGLSFAIPIEVAMEVVDQIKSKGFVSRGWLGVLIQDITRELAESFDMSKPEGALVSRVLPDSPAEEAGIQVGDVIVKFGNKPVATSSSLPPMVGRVKVDSKVKVKIIRNGKPVNLTVKLGELPADDDLKLSAAGSSNFSTDRLGLIVEDLTPEQRERMKFGNQGIVVAQVHKGPGRKAGLQRGDIILMLNDADVKDAKQFKKLVDELPKGATARVLVQRNGNPTFLALKLADDD